ncbi:hypothetical protein GCM10010913_04830 [Paenibacillus aceti]|uniref:Uncharacterized protein n=1 Tax=Paenibacillus aceti TaxID=1820010 RepID=A0ABQ1VQ95_9BACL|nr:hypothetical protein GCM10010913_04830 [Paenibacillus aceti]
MVKNGLYVLCILASTTMMLTLGNLSTLPFMALIGAIIISIMGIVRNKTRKQF